MKNSTIFLTRKCPRNCEYCDIHNPNSSIKQELTLEQWVEAFRILKEIGVTFNLILGNEAWLLKENLLTLLSSTTVPYALYTTCPEPIFTNYRDKFLSSGVLDNFSVAVDYPIYFLEDKLKNLSTLNDMEQKSYAGFKGLKWVREHYPEIDTQAQFTIHRKNFQMLPQVVKDCNEIGAFMGVNFIHWNKDGNYDFFPIQDVLKEFIFQPNDLPELKEIIEEVQSMPNLIQNIELFTEDIVNLTSMGGHCEGDPYGGPSVDSDGTLRTCFTSGHKISSITKDKFIEDLQIGDLIVGWDESKKECSMTEVINISKRSVEDLTKIFFKTGGFVEVTPEHPFYVVSKGWVEAGDLKEGDDILELPGELKRRFTLGVRNKLNPLRGLSNGFFGKKHSEETLQNLRNKTLEQFKNPEKIKKWKESHEKAMKSSEVREKISLGKKGKCFGEKNPMFGKTHSVEVKKLLSIKAKEWMNKNGNPMSRPEVRAKMLGELNPTKRPEVRQQMSLNRKKFHKEHPEYAKKMSELLKKVRQTKSWNSCTSEGNKKISEAHKKLWENPEYRSKRLEKIKNRVYSKEGRQKVIDTCRNNVKNMKIHHLARSYKKPTSVERLLLEVCQDFPIKYVGNGKFWLTDINNKDKNPDFIVENQNKAIEITYTGVHKTWENLSDDAYIKKCENFYNSIGWKCLTIIVDKNTIKENLRSQVSSFICNGLQISRIEKIKMDAQVWNIECEPHKNYFVLPKDKHTYPGILVHNCGYRKGTNCAKLSIFDLPEKLKEWEEAVRLDAQECPGCEWSFPWMYRYWKKRDEKFGEKVLTKHAGEHIDKLKWSKRIIE